MKLLTAIKTSYNNTSFKIKANAPTIGIFVGVGCFIGATVVAAIQAYRIPSRLETRDNEVQRIDDVIEECTNEEQIEELMKKRQKAIIKCYIAIIASFVPVAILSAGGGTCIFASHKKMLQRNAALSAAYAGIDRAYKQYKKRVEESIGTEEADKLKYESDKPEESVPAYNGKACYNVDRVMGCSPYARLFDETCESYSKNHRENVSTLRLAYEYANRQLERKGYLFLNEVYELLGYKPTQAGQAVGWVRSSRPEKQIGDPYVSFGFNPYDVELYSECGREAWLLDFNVCDISKHAFDYKY